LAFAPGGGPPGRSAPGGKAAQGHDAQGSATGRSLRVLAVDDNVDGVEGLAAYLELDGHVVRTAFDGPSALATAETFLPHAALLDIGLPGMSGYELAQRLRAQPHGKRIYLVAITGWGSDEDKRRTREAGFDVHLTKPVGPNVFTRLLAQLDVPGEG
jgi:CheY-like chemotaxis protein